MPAGKIAMRCQSTYSWCSIGCLPLACERDIWTMQHLSEVGCTAFFLTMLTAVAMAKPPDVILEENKVPAYSLPELLTLADGAAVNDATTWLERRRPEILRLFETEVYGRTPQEKIAVEYQMLESDPRALNGLATRKQVQLVFGDKSYRLSVVMLLYLPNDAPRPVPMFLGLNFKGNHTVHADPAILLPTEETAIPGKPLAKDEPRGSMARRWPLETVLRRGYGVATIWYGEIDPDFDDGFKNGPHPLFYRGFQTKPAANQWASIGGWAWGLSRALDYLETDAVVDAKRVAVIGHSRLGKTALWAGAQDVRFALVISNDSGCGGAALSMRQFGERLELINRVNPHWFCKNFRKYNYHEHTLPVDQHMLIALIAPRPVYVASASEDLHADPRGEFLAAKLAEPVYRLLGKEGLPLEGFPQPNQGAAGTIGYHLRQGKHDILQYDWQRFLDFADQNLR